ncbi:MAG: NAD(P)-dependent oxidoreductase [Chromatiales bacterium]|nr:NAD(P)-dependent oxidoreductase [Chromatiales bacterium]
MTEKIAFVGIGIMGRPIVQRLLVAGHQVFIFARHPEVAKPLLKQGACLCKTPASAASKASLCFSMVSDTSDVEEVILGGDGFAEGASRGDVIVDMSTISPEATCDIAEQLSGDGIDMLDAPVSGGEQGAIEGRLSIMVGGKENIYNRVLPIFQIMGHNIVRIGAHGAGQVAKACNQLLVAQTIVATAEAIEFAEHSGVDAARVREALLGGFANSKILEVHGQRILADDYKPGFKAALHFKDLKIARCSASNNGIYLAGLEHAYDCLQRLVERGDGELDSSAMAKIVSEGVHK